MTSVSGTLRGLSFASLTGLSTGLSLSSSVVTGSTAMGVSTGSSAAPANCQPATMANAVKQLVYMILVTLLIIILTEPGLIAGPPSKNYRSEEHTSELQSQSK